MAVGEASDPQQNATIVDAVSNYLKTFGYTKIRPEEQQTGAKATEVKFEINSQSSPTILCFQKEDGVQLKNATDALHDEYVKLCQLIEACLDVLRPNLAKILFNVFVCFAAEIIFVNDIAECTFPLICN